VPMQLVELEVLVEVVLELVLVAMGALVELLQVILVAQVERDLRLQLDKLAALVVLEERVARVVLQVKRVELVGLVVLVILEVLVE